MIGMKNTGNRFLMDFLKKLLKKLWKYLRALEYLQN